MNWGEIEKVANDQKKKNVINQGYISDHFKASDFSDDETFKSISGETSKFGSLELQIDGFSYFGDEMIDQYSRKDD